MRNLQRDLEQVAKELERAEPDESAGTDDEANLEVQRTIADVKQELNGIKPVVADIQTRVLAAQARLTALANAEKWKHHLASVKQKYDDIRLQLTSSQGTGEDYPALLARRRRLEGNLREAEAQRTLAQETGAQAEAALSEILKIRNTLTERRRVFVETTLRGNATHRFVPRPLSTEDGRSRQRSR